MDAQNVLNYYFQNPPFEISDTAKYMEMIQFVTDMSLTELSENNPIMEEKTFTSDASSDDYVLHDLTDIDAAYMELMMLQETATMVSALEMACYRFSPYGGVMSGSLLQRAMDEGSVISFLAVRDSLTVIEEWFQTKVRKMIFGGNKIKLKQNTEYYVLYRRYKTVDEVSRKEVRIFKDLFEINLMLNIYQSDTFASEGGIKSVSLSGLSVSFNVPDATQKSRELVKRKEDLMSQLAIDYSDGMVGLI